MLSDRYFLLFYSCQHAFRLVLSCANYKGTRTLWEFLANVSFILDKFIHFRQRWFLETGRRGAIFRVHICVSALELLSTWLQFFFCRWCLCPFLTPEAIEDDVFVPLLDHRSWTCGLNSPKMRSIRPISHCFSLKKYLWIKFYFLLVEILFETEEFKF